MANEIFTRAHSALLERDVVAKCDAASRLFADWSEGLLAMEPDVELPAVIEPGRPARPVLVHPRELPRRRPGSLEGRVALIHAISHIEFNAINLALDAVQRFRALPREFYSDWLQVAAEEAKHFQLLENRLNALGHAYGDLPAHNGLWDMAMRTAHDPLHRMALVPRVMEARGLDVTPGMIDRLGGLGDHETVAALEVILHEEVGHVAGGTRWFHYLCDQRGLNPEETYFTLLTEYLGEDIRCPLHLEARREAGFSEHELERLKEICTRS